MANRTKKIKAGLVQIGVDEFVGEHGTIFYDPELGALRLSDGITPGGTPLSGGGGVDVEEAQDAAASLFTDGSHTNITFTYNDALNKIDAAVNVPVSILDGGGVDDYDIPDLIPTIDAGGVD